MSDGPAKVSVAAAEKKIVTAEGLLFQKLEQEFKGDLLRDVVVPTTTDVQPVFDGVVSSSDGPIFLEVFANPAGELSAKAVASRSSNFAQRLTVAFPRANYPRAIGVFGARGREANVISDHNNRHGYGRDGSGEIELRYYDLGDLEKEFGVTVG